MLEDSFVLKIRESLNRLPIQMDQETEWFPMDNLFPMLGYIFSVIEPKSVAIIGTRLGYNVVSILSAWSNIETLDIYDSDSRLINGNVLTQINIDAFLLDKNINVKYDINYDDLEIKNKSIDIVYINNPFDNVDQILARLFVCGYINITKCMLIDDFEYVDRVKHAVTMYCRITNRKLYRIKNVLRGIALIDMTNNFDIANTLANNISIDIEEVDLNIP